MSSIIDALAVAKSGARNKAARHWAQDIASLEPSAEWGFAELTQKDTRYATHGYHRYPAKYIPQLARKLILAHSAPNDLVIDPFGGCGTTAVEAKLKGRRALALDVNPVAVMISRSKIKAINPKLLQNTIQQFWQRFDGLSKENERDAERFCPDKERIDYWFRQSEKLELAKILSVLKEEKVVAHQFFLFCAFSNILKNCSMWSMKSNKPLYQKDKAPSTPAQKFRQQLKAMSKMNAEYWKLLQDSKNNGMSCIAKLGSADSIPVDDGGAKLIVTSPPYVTSYEYADLHQLTALWMKGMDDWREFRKKFIGSSYAQRPQGDMLSPTAEDIVFGLGEKNVALGKKTAVYFTDMAKVFTDFRRVLTARGHACVVIGDTELRGVKIQNTQVFIEQLETLGFVVKDVVRRRVISKCIPATRDAKTGKFASVKKSDKVVYPTEQIIVAQKR